MKILKIALDTDEVTSLISELTKRFTTEDKRQIIEGELNESISWESQLELYTEYFEFDENHQTGIKNRSVVKFRLTFFDDGDECKCTNADEIYEKVIKYYEI